jgi:hypothetical protein
MYCTETTIALYHIWLQVYFLLGCFQGPFPYHLRCSILASSECNSNSPNIRFKSVLASLYLSVPVSVRARFCVRLHGRVCDRSRAHAHVNVQNGHGQLDMDMVMQHGHRKQHSRKHAAWTCTCSMDMYMQHGHGARSMDVGMKHAQRRAA